MTVPEPAPGPLAGDPLRAAMELLGDQWTLLILQSVFLRVRRYEELRLRLGISPTALATRLRVAVAAGVLVRAPYRGERRTRHEYRLTPRGLRLWSLLVAIWSWERTWVAGREAALPRLRHLDCDGPTSAPLACRTCGDPVGVREVRAVRAPGVPVSAATAHRRFRRKDAESVAGDPLLFFPATMELLGDRWSAGLLISAFLGARHFSEFQRELGIGPSVLSERLRRLVAAEVMTTTSASTRTDASAYRLTAKGRAFFPALAYIVDWSRPAYPPASTPLVTLRHHDHDLRPTPLCDHCGTFLTRTTIHFA